MKAITTARITTHCIRRAAARIPFCLVLLAMAGTDGAAQTTVYESKDAAGPVFSDQPSFTDQPATGKSIVVPPVNTMQGVPAQAMVPSTVAGTYYTGLTIGSPANGDTLHTNTGAFDMRVDPTPALRAAMGDRIRVKLDGSLLASRYAGGTISITEDDWRAATEDVEHTLQAAIVDSMGNVLIEAVPVRFFAHRATVRREVR